MNMVNRVEGPARSPRGRHRHDAVHGVWPALVTSLTPEGEIDAAAAERLVEALMAAGRIQAEALITRLPLHEFACGVDLALRGEVLKVVFAP